MAVFTVFEVEITPSGLFFHISQVAQCSRRRVSFTAVQHSDGAPLTHFGVQIITRRFHANLA
jgi:hypothetical protein